MEWLVDDNGKEARCGCGKEARYMFRESLEAVPTYACNKYGRCPSYQELVNNILVLKHTLLQYREAMEFTRQYIGKKNLPEIEGWSWYDADQQAKQVLDKI